MQLDELGQLTHKEVNGGSREGTRPTNLRARERELRALQFRKGGASYSRIGKELGISKVAAFKAVKRVLAVNKATIDKLGEEVLELEQERLDDLLMAHWRQAMAGHLGSSAVVLRVMERRAKMLGLDRPAVHEVSGPDNGPIEIEHLSDAELEQRVKLLIAAAGLTGDAGTNAGDSAPEGAKPDEGNL